MHNAVGNPGCLKTSRLAAHADLPSVPLGEIVKGNLRWLLLLTIAVPIWAYQGALALGSMTFACVPQGLSPLPFPSRRCRRHGAHVLCRLCSALHMCTLFCTVWRGSALTLRSLGLAGGTSSLRGKTARESSTRTLPALSTATSRPTASGECTMPALAPSLHLNPRKALGLWKAASAVHMHE